jgi:hypothetical protein
MAVAKGRQVTMLTSRTAAVSSLIFIGGFLAGQQRSKFDGYLHPVSVTKMDIAVIQAQLDIIRSLSQSNDGLGMPTVSYDQACHCFVSSVMIIGDEFMKQSLEQVQSKMIMRAGAAYVGIRSSVPELSKWGSNPAPEIKVTFQEFSAKGGIRSVAEYSNGQLILK